MNSRETTALQLTHRLASEAHRAMADANMSITDLAAKIGESPTFLRRVLVGENGNSRVRLSLFADIAWATQQWMSLSVTPIPDVKPETTVKGGTK